MAANALAKTLIPRPVATKTGGGDVSLGSRQTQELVFALVGPVGSGVTTTATILSEIMKETYAYEFEIVKISKIIESDARKVSMEVDLSGVVSRIEGLQSAGNALREKYGHDYLAKRVVETISNGRQAVVASDNDVESPFKNAKRVED